jgi:hypothetical protein
MYMHSHACYLLDYLSRRVQLGPVPITCLPNPPPPPSPLAMVASTHTSSLVWVLTDAVCGCCVCSSLCWCLCLRQIGSSLFDEAGAALVPGIMAKAAERNVAIHLPTDYVTASGFAEGATVGAASDAAGGIPAGWLGLDIGPLSIAAFRDVALAAKTILWNGYEAYLYVYKYVCVHVGRDEKGCARVFAGRYHGACKRSCPRLTPVPLGVYVRLYVIVCLCA